MNISASRNNGTADCPRFRQIQTGQRTHGLHVIAAQPRRAIDKLFFLPTRTVAARGAESRLLRALRASRAECSRTFPLADLRMLFDGDARPSGRSEVAAAPASPFEMFTSLVRSAVAYTVKI